MRLNAGKFAAGLLLITVRLFAQAAPTQADQHAYCDYLSQQAMAQRDRLRTPSAVAGVTQPNEALPMQVVWGLSESLSDLKKAGLTMQVAQKNCDLYTATTAAQQHIQYALPSLEKQALRHRLELIQQASEKLDGLMATTGRMLDVRNVTRPMLFSLQTVRIKLDADQSDTQSKIAALYVPDLNDAPLKVLVGQKQAGEASAQAALDELSRQNDWDVALSFGARQQVNPFDNRGLYGAVTISYNLASRAINRHLDQAADAFQNWKDVQEGEVARNAEVLRQQLAKGIQAQETRLKSLQDEQREIESNLKIVDNVETTAALDFRNQLAGTQLLLEIEIGDAGFRLEALQEFLEKNY